MADFQKVEIFMSGRNLKDKDVFSKSDPFVVLYVKDLNSHQYIKIGRTETIKDNLNPNFINSFIVDYIFEQKQDCKFEVFDDDDGSSEMIGMCESTIGSLMGAQKQTTVFDLKLKNNTKASQGKLVVRCDNVKESNEHVLMKVNAIKLMNTDGWFDKSDPFLRISKIRSDNTIQKIYESEVVMNNLNPNWKPFEIPASRLCNGEYQQPFKLEVYDWEKNGKFQFIGDIQLTLGQIRDGQREFELHSPKKKHPGKIKFEQFQIIVKPSFLDYIRGGLQLNLVLAVDYTGSNGIPTAPSSLHFLNPNNLNQYQQAIISVGEILIAYDYDQKVPCYGFGAKTRFPTLQSNQVLHCFPLSGNPQNVEGFGIKNILDLYQYSLQHVELAGPTYFGPIISETMKLARQIKQEEGSQYMVLLILTDGEIHDMSLTKSYIVEAGNLPMSIIIVGIGQADFSNMEVLDGDSGLRDDKGRQSVRDLVQFVPFRQFNHNSVALAKHVLAEIPQQVVKYHQLIGKKPNAPVQVDMNQLGYSMAPNAPQQQQPDVVSQLIGNNPQVTCNIIIYTYKQSPSFQQPPPQQTNPFMSQAPNPYQSQPPNPYQSQAPNQYQQSQYPYPQQPGQYPQQGPPPGQYQQPPPGQDPYQSQPGQYPQPSQSQYSPQGPPGQYQPPPGQYPPTGQYPQQGPPGQYPPQQNPNQVQNPMLGSQQWQQGPPPQNYNYP